MDTIFSEVFQERFTKLKSQLNFISLAYYISLQHIFQVILLNYAIYNKIDLKHKCCPLYIFLTYTWENALFLKSTILLTHRDYYNSLWFSDIFLRHFDLAPNYPFYICKMCFYSLSVLVNIYICFLLIKVF